MSVENGVALNEVRSGLCRSDRGVVEAVARAFWMAHRWGPRLSRFVGQVFDESPPRPLKEWEIGEDGQIAYPSGMTAERFGRVLVDLWEDFVLALSLLQDYTLIRERHPDRFSKRSAHEISYRLRIAYDQIALAAVLGSDDLHYPRSENWRGLAFLVRPHLGYLVRHQREFLAINDELTASRDLFDDNSLSNRDGCQPPIIVESETEPEPEPDWLQPVPESDYRTVVIRAIDGGVVTVDLSPEMSRAIKLLDRERRQPSSEGWISVRLMRTMMHFRKVVDPTRSVRQDIDLARRKILQRCLGRVRGKRRLVQPASVG